MQVVLRDKQLWQLRIGWTSFSLGVAHRTTGDVGPTARWVREQELTQEVSEVHLIP